MTYADWVCENRPHCCCCTVSHDAEQTCDKLVPLNVSCSATRLVAMTVPATVDEHRCVTRQRLTQSFQAPAYYRPHTRRCVTGQCLTQSFQAPAYYRPHTRRCITGQPHTRRCVTGERLTQSFQAPAYYRPHTHAYFSWKVRT